MADTKITALSAITIVDPANDVLPIVDVSNNSMAASGTTCRVTTNQLLGAGGTATLASATISGDLTVDTSTLKVDSANDRVGIGLAAGINAKLHVSSTGSVHINQRTGNNGCFTQYMDPTSSNYVGTDSGNFRVANNSGQDLLNIEQLGVFTFGDGAGGTRMTLNSTGLGVGVSPSYKLDVLSTGVIAQFLRDLTVDTGIQLQADNSGSIIKCIGNQGLRFNVSSADAMTLDASGNLILLSSNTPATLTTNGQLTVNATSNTNLRFSYRGSDGTTRTADITLA